MSEAEPKMTREEYIKATGISGDKLVDDVDKAHNMAKAGDEHRTDAARIKKTAKVIVDSALGLSWDHPIDEAYKEALSKLSSNDRMDKLSRAEQVLVKAKINGKWADDDELKDDLARAASRGAGREFDMATLVGVTLDTKGRVKHQDSSYVLPHTDDTLGKGLNWLASYRNKAIDEAEEEEQGAAERYDDTKTRETKAKELMSKFK